MKQLLLSTIALLLITSCKSDTHQSKKSGATSSQQLSKAEHLIHDMTEAIGGIDALKKLKDVEYQYTYESFDGFSDVSTERYIFDGEYSWGEYKVHKNAVMTNVEGVITQGYDGIKSWVAVDDSLSTDPAANQMSAFLRKTNFYWFCMNFKLLDPGVKHSYEGTRSVNNMAYDLVKITFEEGIGTSQDEYLLYFNPQTKLIDQFLFTVKALGIDAPLMMRLKYEEVSGVKLTTYREYAPATWEGELTSNEGWTKETSKHVKFNNGFKPADFPSVR